MYHLGNAENLTIPLKAKAANSHAAFNLKCS
jgi:hypothetical protein